MKLYLPYNTSVKAKALLTDYTRRRSDRALDRIIPYTVEIETKLFSYVGPIALDNSIGGQYKYYLYISCSYASVYIVSFIRVAPNCTITLETQLLREIQNHLIQKFLEIMFLV